MDKDEILEKREKVLERRITEEYQRAYNEIARRAKQYLDKFDKADKAKKVLLEQGKITPKEYLEWRKGWIRRTKEYEAMLDDCAETLTNASIIASSYARGESVNMFAMASNWAAYDVCKDLNLNIDFTIYNKESVMRMLADDPDLLPEPRVNIPKTKRWNKHHIQSEVTQGIIQGKSIDKVAKGLARAVGMSKNASVRNARTSMCYARSAGSLERYREARDDYGIDVKKQWLATPDGRTRHEHRELDGQIQELDEPFYVDGYPIMCPSDPTAAPHLIYNCRCALEEVVGKYNNNFNFDIMGDMDYEEWVKGGKRHRG